MSRYSEVILPLLPAAIEIRHDLHQNPELGYQETRTSQVVRQELESIGIEFVGGLAGGTGVVGYLPATVDGGKTVGLRADMDALPIHEETGLPYASKTPGCMHACGHDGHTTILLTVAKTLAATPERKNNVLFVFQPAEEGGAGAKKLCEEGVLQGKVIGKPVDIMYGLHGSPFAMVGKVGTKAGPMMACATEIAIVIEGKGTHAAYPNSGIDPIVVLAHIVTALQTVASRTVGPLDSVVVTIGKIEAGVAHNVIPDTAKLSGTLRTLKSETDQIAQSRIRDIVQNVSAAFGAKGTVEFSGAYPVVVNDSAATQCFFDVAKETLGDDNVFVIEEPSMGGEDFSFYGLEVPACFYWLGLKPTEDSVYPNLHSPKFDFNDDAIAVGVQVMVSLAMRV